MSADMELCRRVDKFVIRLFLTYLLHFRTAVIADRMLFLMLDYLEIHCFHPVIVSTLLSAFMLRDCD